ncbi:HET-domain-containing protein [Mytilinidion resinicola]|uniref:HET-domain-containing protein n=1 Tax=Mytilinidion resinicola TaxID=574789 RepID=A0A6A6Y2D6_9PEZI|nr:HET-domain-containing protein [Mytilinidion resinicola]KAF2802820.1 HET-domain-containing protein [Mytilinidion resinicola]
MRLLRWSNNTEFGLTDDLADDEAIPPYAILSHTWLEDTQEPTFEDLTNGTGREKLGYEKIQFCGGQAKQDNLQYFWVDTCCINKSNPAELSHSINSMFRWYRNATRCYVYLSDVSSPRTNDVFHSQSWDLDLARSRWFTRGWTLQDGCGQLFCLMSTQPQRHAGHACVRDLGPCHALTFTNAKP